MIKYIEANAKDMADVAKTHMTCFPDYFLTKLDGGKGEFLSRYYQYWLGENCIFFIAKDDQKCIGFVCGSIKPYSPRMLFEKEQKGLLIKRVSLLLLRFNKMAWQRVFKRIKEKFCMAKAKQPLSAQQEVKEASLLSICVLPEYRGKHISTELVKEFEKKCVSYGVKAYTLSALKINDRGNAFYKKIGMTVKSESDTSLYYYKELAGDGGAEV